MGLKEQSILLRPAKPEFGEGLQFAHYLDQAAEGFFRFMLGSESENIIASAFADSGHPTSNGWARQHNRKQIIPALALLAGCGVVCVP